MNKSRPAPYYNRSNSLQSQDFSTQLNSTMSLPYSSFLKNDPAVQPLISLNEQTCNMNSTSAEQDDGGVVLQISNLDQWYDEANMRHYLLSQLKPITPILSLIIESPSIAKVKVPSQQVSAIFLTAILKSLSIFLIGKFYLSSLPNKLCLICIVRKSVTSVFLCHISKIKPQPNLQHYGTKLLVFFVMFLIIIYQCVSSENFSNLASNHQ